MIYIQTVLSEVDPFNYYLVVGLILVTFITILFFTFFSMRKNKKNMTKDNKEQKADDFETKTIALEPKTNNLEAEKTLEQKTETVKPTPKKINIEINSCERDAFSILGKVIYFDQTKTTDDINVLWNEAGMKYGEIAIFAKKDDGGNAVGFWGAMSDETMSFLPWKDFKEGYYMAGVEVGDRIKAPKGWEKWTIPAFEYLYARIDDNYQEVFDYVIQEYIPQKGLNLVGAVQEYNCPAENGQLYLFFPIKKI